MDFRQLKSFCAVVEEGTLMRAAESLDYAQSTITLHLQELETSIGLPLFERRGRRLQLTEAGQTFYQKAAQVLKQVDHLQASMQDLLSGEGGEVRFAAIEPTLSMRLPPVIAAYSQAWPRVRLVVEAGTNSIAERVNANELDFGLCGPPDTQSKLTFEPLFREELILLMAKDDPLSHLPRIQVSDLVGQRLLLTGPSCIYRGTLERELLRRGLSIDSAVEASELETLKQLVQYKVGVAVVPRLSVLTPPTGTVARSIDGMPMNVEIGIVRRSDDFARGQAYTHLLKVIREQLPIN
jgi:LysR family transcriptional regulator, regulator of the ytmI operon